MRKQGQKAGFAQLGESGFHTELVIRDAMRRETLLAFWGVELSLRAERSKKRGRAREGATGLP